MLPEGFINLSSLHSHGKKEVCLSEAAQLHARTPRSPGKPLGEAVWNRAGLRSPPCWPFLGGCEDVAGSLPGVNETRRGADLAELSQDGYRFMC